jgi:hypothetical protein
MVPMAIGRPRALPARRRADAGLLVRDVVGDDPRVVEDERLR